MIAISGLTKACHSTVKKLSEGCSSMRIGYLSTFIFMVVGVPGVRAQESEPGVFVRAAAGLGVDITAGYDGGNPGYAANVQLGFKVKSSWIGVEHTGWFDHENTGSRSVVRSAFVMASPFHRGPYLKGGAGLATSNPVHPTRLEVVQRYGVGVVGGVGYDIALNPTVSIGASADFLYHQYGSDAPLPSSKQVVIIAVGGKFLVWKKK